MSNLASFMEGVARILWGDPNDRLSSSTELRFGNHGGRAVDISKGVWSNHDEANGTPERGGGVLDLIRIETGLEGKAAFEWLKQHGFPVEDRPAGERGSRSADRPKSAPAKSSAPKAAEPKKEKAPREPKKLVRAYDYTDGEGTLLYQVCRYEPKTFTQRRPSPTEPGVWFNGLDAGEYMRRRKGDDWFRYDPKRYEEWRCTERTTLEAPVDHGLYMLPELEEALAEGALIFLPEGEKDVETLRAMGAPATTNSGGAKNWSDAIAAHFAGASVVLPIDNDKPGRERGAILARSLKEVGAVVKVLDVSHHWADCPEKGDVTDWRETGGLTLERLYEIVDGLPEWTAEVSEEMGELAGDRFDEEPGEGYVPRLRLVMWSDLDVDPEPHEWLIKGLVTRGELVLVPGSSGSGKTFAVLDAAMSIARGVPFLGYKVRQGGVVYQAGEGYKGFRSKRLKAYRRRYSLGGGDALPFAVIGSPIDLHANDADTHALISDIKFAASHWKERLELVVIDTLSAATPGANENTSEDISRVLKRCEMIRAATGATVLLVHHMNADGTKARGHTSLGANVDSVLVCRKHEEMHDARGRMIRELEVKKQKDGEDGLKVRFVLQSIEIDRDEDGDAITSCTITAPEGNVVDKSEKGGAGRLSAQAMNFLQAIEKAIASHGVTAATAAIPDVGSTVVVAEYGHVRDAFAAASFEGDAGDEKKRGDAIRQAIKRQGEALLARGLIGRHGRFLWRTEKALPKTSSNDDRSPPPAVEGDPGWTPPEDVSADWGSL